MTARKDGQSFINKAEIIMSHVLASASPNDMDWKTKKKIEFLRKYVNPRPSKKIAQLILAKKMNVN